MSPARAAVFLAGALAAPGRTRAFAAARIVCACADVLVADLAAVLVAGLAAGLAAAFLAGALAVDFRAAAALAFGRALAAVSRDLGFSAPRAGGLAAGREAATREGFALARAAACLGWGRPLLAAAGFADFVFGAALLAGAFTFALAVTLRIF